VCHDYGMPDRTRKKRPSDANKRAFDIVRESTGEVELEPESHKNKAAVELGRLGGLKGGKARAAKMTPEERSEAARKAANTRWKKQSKTTDA